jgi:flagellar basal body-associated protein FliL
MILETPDEATAVANSPPRRNEDTVRGGAEQAMSHAMVLVVFVLVLVLALLGAVWWILRRRGAYDSTPRCGRCGYNLTGNTGNRCPECGAMFVEAGVVIRAGQQAGNRRTVYLTSIIVVLLLAAGAMATLFSYVAALRAREAAAAARAQAMAVQAQRAAGMSKLQADLLKKVEDRNLQAATAPSTQSAQDP